MEVYQALNVSTLIKLYAFIVLVYYDSRVRTASNVMKTSGPPRPPSPVPRRRGLKVHRKQSVRGYSYCCVCGL